MHSIFRDRLGRLAWLLWGVAAVVWTAGLPLFVLTWVSPVHAWSSTAMYAVLAMLFLILQAIGVLIVSRRGGNPIGWIFCTLGLIGVVSGFCVAYAAYSLLAAPGGLPGGRIAAWLGTWITDPGLYLVGVYLPVLFPTGRAASPRWRAVLWIAAAGAILLASFTALRPGPLRLFPTVLNPFDLTGVPGRLLLVAGVAGLSSLVILTPLSALSVVLRMRRAEGDEREQLRLFVATSILLAVGLIGLVVLGILFRLPNALARVPLELALASIPIAAAVALFKYRLYELDVWINRGLVYGSLTLGVVAVYVAVVETAAAFFRSGSNLAVSLLATCLLALLLAPLRQRLQEAVNRLMYGDRDDPYRALSQLGRRLEASLAAEAVLPAVVETVAHALRLPYAAIALRQEAGLRLAASWGREVAGVLCLPLVYQQDAIGEMILAPRSPHGAFNPADRRLLEDLARHVGVAAHAVRLTAELQRARERLVLAREEERRRLRRDLHDGLGPRLAGMTLRIEAARNRLAPDLAGEPLLADVAGQAQDAIADIRRLVQGLRPPALDDLGLVSALREAAAELSLQRDAGLQIVVTAPAALPPLPAAAEVAAYRIAHEAMTNVLRHAGAHRCLVRLCFDEHERALRLEVRDDGHGLGPEPRAGMGLSSMHERAEELGGTCRIDSPVDGGTLVRVALPCGSPGGSVPEPDEAALLPSESATSEGTAS